MKEPFGFYQIPSSRYDPDPPNCLVKKWLRKVGDQINRDDSLLVYEADKVGEIELESPFSGTIVSINPEYLEEADEESRLWIWNKKKIELELSGKKVILHLPELGYIETDKQVAGVADTSEPIKENAGELEAQAVPIRASPAARKLARELGIDITAVKGTGFGGRVMRADVERAIAGPPESAEAPKTIPARAGVIMLTPSREWLTIRDNLAGGTGMPTAGGEPLREGSLAEYDLSELLRIKAQYRNEFKAEFDAPLHLTAPVALAVTRVLRIRRFWTFNGYWHIDENDRSRDKVALYTAVNMGFAVDFGKEPEIDLEKGTLGGTRLRIATLHGADQLGIKEFIKQHHSLMQRASYDISENAGKLKETTLHDWTGWTFIFNNIGAARHVRGLSVLTKRISAMLNMGVIGKDGKTVFQIFFDHRLIDGVPATLFMDAVCEELTKRVIPEIELACAGRKRQ